MEYFEDIAVGDTDDYGSYTVDAEEIMEFAGQYDPQPFHTDEEAAAESLFGGLVASGWHTSAITMRLLVTGIFPETSAMGAVGVDELRWPNPVRPGDELHVETEVLETEADYRPGVGLVRSRVETFDAEGELKQHFVSRALYGQR
ncbi:MaoC family dehydratase [Haloarchaeobius iranensis]|uniref:Acyl dehydratase n=1 Tax=Haloarchaeobius iranensis TaxID=996166 RepID=A0A1G9SLN3_9EURY|nr:MaoC family dehydratase [Haloarchaeobius iranensis]SDM36394.1 Acyl dehydratase [Haloarchaeobius iranensis]